MRQGIIIFTSSRSKVGLRLIWYWFRPGKTRVKFRNPLTTGSCKYSPPYHPIHLLDLLWRKALPTSDVGLLGRMSAVVHSSSCATVHQSVSETQSFHPMFWLHTQIKRGSAAEVVMLCSERLSESVLAYSKQIIIIIVFLVWTTWMHQGEITWHTM